jgi:hypothetical protein
VEYFRSIIILFIFVLITLKMTRKVVGYYYVIK